ncbi:MAG: hydantoinase/oxoprolinase family protein [Pseudomonadota bacterium]
MTLLLGLDTGGTFTDAVIMRTRPGENPAVAAKAKALTTKDDLAIGIAGAVDAVLGQMDGQAAQEIGMVSLSTTLATNALVEGQGGRVALVAIGFDERDLKNAGLDEAIGGDPVIMLPGGHTTHGGEAQPLDRARLDAQLSDLQNTVSGFAVAGYFAVRNPAHENAVRDLITAKTGMPVTCSHELSARLNGPKRALTTVLNARLIPMIDRLITACRATLAKRKIKAPLMVVRGDGALVSADFAARRPIETILSGPAASLVGAQFLTGEDRAFVNDIGGTTSDVALLEGGRPRIDPDGARVGGFRTMVEAVAMHTFGLGGDSEVGVGGSGLRPELTLGPRRLVPVSLAAHRFGSLVHGALDAQLQSTLVGRFDGRFAWRSGMGVASGLSKAEQSLFDSLTHEPVALEGFLKGNAQSAALKRLVSRGLVSVAGLTPSDAMHGLGLHGQWDGEAALKALRLFGRRKDGGGKALSDDLLSLARCIVSTVERRSAEVVLETALQVDGRETSLVQHELLKQVLDARAGEKQDGARVQFSFNLDRPLIGLGASAHAYHPKAARLLDTKAIVPDHADVANAIGAVVGQVMVRAETLITQPAEGRFQVTGVEKPFADEESALAHAEESVRAEVQRLAQEAGAADASIHVEHQAKRATIESRDMLVELRLTATASGRPPIAEG